MTADVKPPEVESKPPIYRDVKFLRTAGQIFAVGVVALIVFFLLNNLVTNLGRRNIGTDFGFLNRPTQFQIPYHQGFNPRSSVWGMVFVGIKNTFLAGLVGIALATVIGVVLGIARLSKNWLVARFAEVYVEFFRNIPPLVIIIFFGFAVFTFGPFPIVEESWEYSLPGTDETFLIINNDRWGIPSFFGGDNAVLFWFFVVFALIVAWVVWWYRTKVNEQTGRPHHRALWALGTFVGLTVVGFFVLGTPLSWSLPRISENRRLIVDGFIVNWGYISVTVALALYTASHIAEIVRGSILAVPMGQTEAANALALSGFQRYRFVVLPQAMRIAVPPIINQFLNLVKNTSLATAVGYADITALTKTSIGNGRPAPQSIVILMAVYLLFSLSISFLLNIVNRRLQIAGR